jgi:hypothetical protein
MVINAPKKMPPYLAIGRQFRCRDGALHDLFRTEGVEAPIEPREPVQVSLGGGFVPRATHGDLGHGREWLSAARRYVENHA